MEYSFKTKDDKRLLRKSVTMQTFFKKPSKIKNNLGASCHKFHCNDCDDDFMATMKKKECKWCRSENITNIF